MTTIRTLQSLATKKGWPLYQLDVNNAFLHGDLKEEVYMKLPPGLSVDQEGLVCRLKKSLYGLKQTSRQWYDKLTESLCSRGFVHSASDYSLFYRKNEKSLCFVVVYVDDVIITGTNMCDIQDLKRFLHYQFKIKDLGKLHYFLELEILYTTDGALISQRKFAADLLKECDCLNYTKFSSPLDSTVKLYADKGKLLSDPSIYRKLVGKLNFLTNTRLDIAYSVQHLSQFMHAPREPHYQAALHVLRYIKNDPTLGIFLSNKPDYTVSAHYDSDLLKLMRMHYVNNY